MHHLPLPLGEVAERSEDGEGESVTRPSQSPAVTALPEGEPRLQLFYGHPHDSGGTGGGSPRRTPRRGGAVLCHWGAPRPQICWGVAPLARGPLAPLKSRFKGIGFSGKGGNRNPPFPERVFGYFLHGQKVTRAWGRRSVKKICRWHIFSVGRSGYAARKTA